jgi:hypothetical protein
MLRVYGGPLGPSYLRFDVKGLPGRVARATLRLYAHSPSNAGYQVRSISDPSWNESTITFSNAPPLGDVITISEPFGAKQWTSADLTRLVRCDGAYSVVLMSFDGTPLSVGSAEAIAAHRPQLVVDVLDGSSSIPATQTIEVIDRVE